MLCAIGKSAPNYAGEVCSPYRPTPLELQRTAGDFSLQLEKLSSIEDRRQTDRVTALPRPCALDVDP